MIVVCALLAEEFYRVSVPVVDGLNRNPLKTIHPGDWVRVDGASGVVEVVRENQ